MSLFLLIVGIVLFILLVVIHEWGHFIMARRNGVTVEEFGIFFPPRLFKHKTKGGWDFTINLLPLGGFVRLKGEHDTDTAKGSFGAASVWAKTKIMGAGVFMNLVVALVLLMILALVGMPQLVPNQYTVKSDTKVSNQYLLISYIEPHSPASDLGLKNIDHILMGTTGHFICSSPAVITGAKLSSGPCKTSGGTETKLASVDDLKRFTKANAGKEVGFQISRQGHIYAGNTVLRSQKAVADSQKTNNPKGYLGIAPTAYTVQRSTWSAPIVAVGLTGQFTVLTFQGLGHALAGVGSIIAGAFTGNTQARQHGQQTAGAQVSGPVGVFAILQSGSTLGYQFILLIIAIISLTLAIMNILPIPALDGGRLWLTLFTRGIGRPLKASTEEWINASGFILLIGLMILISVVDVRRFF